MKTVKLEWRNIQIEVTYEMDGNQALVTDVRPLGKWDNMDLLQWFHETEHPLDEISEMVEVHEAELNYNHY